MAFDVPGRLAQGRPSVEVMSEYVWAAHQVGFADADLTLHPGQLRDWYGTEDGMDLIVLQRDHALVDTAARAVREALAVQQDQAGMLSTAWQGPGAQAARQFLHRHGVASAAIADALTAAAAALQRALDQLWHAVDAKVETTIAIESEVGAAREQWRTAAATVTSGAGDRAAAAELVDGAVKPFVQNRIGAEWLAAMQATGSTVAEAYRAATAEISAPAPAMFQIPGVLGPTPSSVSPPTALPSPSAPAAVPGPVSSAAAVPAPTAPAAWTPPLPASAPPPPPPATALPADPPPSAAAPPLGQAAAPMSDLGLGGGGGAMPAVGQRFADALSGLLGGGAGNDAADDAIVPPAGLEPPGFDDADDEPQDEESDEDDEGDEGEPEDDELADDEPNADPIDESSTEKPDSAAVAPPAPTPPPPPAEPLPPPPPVEEETPCEIAADEVPQVGPPPASEPGGG
ncbi:hypothetical protein GR927_28675 [Mycolicibacterium sp. 3033]|nr:hypothetical protein [Mycolicibacterium aurantiacum]